MRDERVRKLALGGLFSALVLLATWQLKVPLPVGYIHLGDGVIFLSAMLLGNYAALIAGVGSALSDLLAGWPQYIAATFVIKALMGLLAASLAAVSPLDLAGSVWYCWLLALAAIVAIAWPSRDAPEAVGGGAAPTGKRRP